MTLNRKNSTMEEQMQVENLIQTILSTDLLKRTLICKLLLFFSNIFFFLLFRFDASLVSVYFLNYKFTFFVQVVQISSTETGPLRFLTGDHALFGFSSSGSSTEASEKLFLIPIPPYFPSQHIF